MERYVGRQEKTGAEGSGDAPRKNPIKDRGLFSNSRHPMLSSCIQLRKLTITIKSILLFQSIKKVLPSSLRGSCNIVVPTVDSSCMHVAPGTAIAASFSSCFFLSSRIPSHPEKTYNLEPPISIYLKNTSLYLEHYPFINIFWWGSALLPSGSGSG